MKGNLHLQPSKITENNGLLITRLGGNNLEKTIWRKLSTSYWNTKHKDSSIKSLKARCKVVWLKHLVSFWADVWQAFDPWSWPWNTEPRSVFQADTVILTIRNANTTKWSAQGESIYHCQSVLEMPPGTQNYTVILERHHKPWRTVLHYHRCPNLYNLDTKYKPGRKKFFNTYSLVQFQKQTRCRRGKKTWKNISWTRWS